MHVRERESVRGAVGGETERRAVFCIFVCFAISHACLATGTWNPKISQFYALCVKQGGGRGGLKSNGKIMINRTNCCYF